MQASSSLAVPAIPIIHDSGTSLRGSLRQSEDEADAVTRGKDVADLTPCRNSPMHAEEGASSIRFSMEPRKSVALGVHGN